MGKNVLRILQVCNRLEVRVLFYFEYKICHGQETKFAILKIRIFESRLLSLSLLNLEQTKIKHREILCSLFSMFVMDYKQNIKGVKICK